MIKKDRSHYNNKFETVKASTGKCINGFGKMEADIQN